VLESLSRACWKLAAVDPVIAPHTTASERRALLIIGVLVGVQALLAGFGAAGSLHLASPRRELNSADALYVVLGFVIAGFWLCISRLSFVAIGQAEGAEVDAMRTLGDAAPATAARRAHQFQPLVLRTVGFAFLGVLLSTSLVIAAELEFKLITALPTSGLLTLVRQAQGRGVTYLAILLLTVLFTVPVLWRSALATQTAADHYDHHHVRVLRECVERQWPHTEAALADALRAWVPDWRPLPSLVAELRWPAADTHMHTLPAAADDDALAELA